MSLVRARHATAFALGCLLLASPALADLSEDLLDQKYKKGDYGLFLGWYDPDDAQFDEHGDFAAPVGVKVRLTFRSWLRAEGEVGYYRRSRGPVSSLGAFATPNFDGLTLGVTGQIVPFQRKFFTPYFGGGLMLVSLSNDFLTVLTEAADAVEEVNQNNDPDDPDQEVPRNVGTWRRFDVGFQVVAGLDIPLGKKAFPFVEFRQLLGRFTIDEVRVGGFRRTPETLEEPAEVLTERTGVLIPSEYDWSGPMIAGGLKIRF